MVDLCQGRAALQPPRLSASCPDCSQKPQRAIRNRSRTSSSSSLTAISSFLVSALLGQIACQEDACGLRSWVGEHELGVEGVCGPDNDPARQRVEESFELPQTSALLFTPIGTVVFGRLTLQARFGREHHIPTDATLRGPEQGVADLGIGEQKAAHNDGFSRGVDHVYDIERQRSVGRRLADRTGCTWERRSRAMGVGDRTGDQRWLQTTGMDRSPMSWRLVATLVKGVVLLAI